MGKIIRAQKIGKRGSKFKIPSHRYKGDVKHLPLYTSKQELVNGEVVDIFHDPGRSAPLAKIKYEDQETNLIIAPLNLKVGSSISYGTKASPKLGSSLALAQIPEGTYIYNIEVTPGDGGKLVRSSGVAARVVSRDKSGTVVQLPSGTFKTLNSKCRANIGTVAGSGRTEKPFIRAGSKFKAMRARGKLYPRVSGMAMNPVDHPYGGGGHRHVGKPTSISRHAPPGRKVGSISPKRTGKRK